MPFWCGVVTNALDFLIEKVINTVECGKVQGIKDIEKVFHFPLAAVAAV